MRIQPRSITTATALALTALMSLAFSASAADYKIDPAHSFVEFKTVHLGYSWLAGRFNKIDGTLKFDPAAGADTQEINLTIDAASVDTNHAERDKHLRSEDFFNVAEFPTVTFNSTGFEGDAAGGTLTGDLTLHGVTKSVSFPIKKIGEGDDPWGGYRAGFEGSYTLVRKDFNMNYNLGPLAENVELELYIEGIRK